jgi:ABC-type glycerol-3-phosphate transport system substrate-binding protein
MEADGLLAPFARTEGSINHYLALLPQGDKAPQSSMLIETSTASSTIRDFLGGELSAEDAGDQFSGVDIDLNKIQIVPGGGALPGIESAGKVFASGGNFFMLNTGTDAEQAAAWEFMKYMLQPENAFLWHTQGGYLPVVKEVLETDEVEEYWETDVAGVMQEKAIEQLYDADPDSPGPLVGPYQGFSDAVDDALDNVLLDGQDPEAQLSEAQETVTGLLEDYNN